MADKKLDVTPQEPAEEIGGDTPAQPEGPPGAGRGSPPPLRTRSRRSPPRSLPPDTAANDSTPSGRTARM